MQKKEELKSIIRRVYPSESALAKDMGCSRQRINNYIRGVRVPTLRDVSDMATLLGVPVDILIGYFLPE